MIRASLYHDVENRVLAHDPRANGECPVTTQEARSLIASGYYRQSTGAPYGARHYRRALADGSCLHLVIEGRRRRLHHDAFDPHASLVSLGMHITHEARSEAASYAALVWSAIKLLAR
ncbi:MAG: hypothetical protein ABSF50_19555 [Burkholderiaceae bacterium]